MASWSERLRWRAEFRQLGSHDVRLRVERVVWTNEEKLQAARNWLWWQEHRLQAIGLVIAGIGGIVGVVTIADKMIR